MSLPLASYINNLNLINYTLKKIISLHVCTSKTSGNHLRVKVEKLLHD